MKNTTENNKLIAEFMGIEERDMVFLFPVNLGKLFYSPNSCYNSKDEDCFELELAGLNYHNSWDWLMRVVEKIGYKAYVSIETRGTRINLKDEIIADIVGRGHKPTMIDNTYQAVVLFIKWYNKNK